MNKRVSGCVTPEPFVRAVAVGTSRGGPDLLLLRATGAEEAHACAREILFEIRSADPVSDVSPARYSLLLLAWIGGFKLFATLRAGLMPQKKNACKEPSSDTLGIVEE
jgi:hypothetical protein